MKSAPGFVSKDAKDIAGDNAPGLAKKIENYLARGDDETVLSTLTTHQASNKAGYGYYHHNNKHAGRRQIHLARANPYDFELAERYGRVLAAISRRDPMHGTKAVSDPIRLLFAEVLQGVDEKKFFYGTTPVDLGYAKLSEKSGLNVENALQLIERMGGVPADLVDVAYAGESSWYGRDQSDYRKAVKFETLAKEKPDVFIEGAKRLQAKDRAILIRELSNWKLATTDAYIEFIVDQAGDTAKTTREEAQAALSDATGDKVEALAAEKLAKGNVGVREAMVQVLVGIGTDSAKAALKAHRSDEKASRVQIAIDNAVMETAVAAAAETEEDDPHSYIALNGERIRIPERKPLADEGRRKFGDPEKSALVQLIRISIEKDKKAEAEAKRNGHRYYSGLNISESTAGHAIKILNLKDPHKQTDQIDRRLFVNIARDWIEKASEDMSDYQALSFACLHERAMIYLFNSYQPSPVEGRIRRMLESGLIDLRHLESFDISAARREHGGIYGLHGYGEKKIRFRKGDYLRAWTLGGYYTEDNRLLQELPHEAVWPYIAENLGVLDEAFGLKSIEGSMTYSALQAVRMLEHLPAVPARYFNPLLEIATGTKKHGRAEARKLLADVPEVDDRLMQLLDDSRQAIRAGAAEWMADRASKGAVKALKARLKKEKSEVAKAAILTALDRLGEDLSDYLSPEALLKEAEKGLKSAKFDKLAWMGLDHLPTLRMKNGKALDDRVLRYWIFLAVKLKQPGGNALFDLYLEQLHPEDAQKVSTWIFDSWIEYDTAKPSLADANAHVEAHAQSRFDSMKKWWKDLTLDLVKQNLKNEYMSQYPNSGAAIKGLLALAGHAPATMVAERVRSYQKNHGARTSQSTSLLEYLAGRKDPVALQVVIASATRLKQKGVQKRAGELVEMIADQFNWTLDELADKTIPTGGFGDDGVLELPVGEAGEKVYSAVIDSDLKVVLRNPTGKPVASIPSSDDENTKASKKALSSAKKEIKQVIKMQTERLYEGLCAERVWTVDDWRSSFAEHPVMRKLVERCVWAGCDEEGTLKAAFRPTAEGDFTNAEDDDVDLESFTHVRLAHGAMMDADDASAWEEHLKDYEVKPLFVQFGRSLLSIADEGVSEKETKLEDRRGWMTDTFSIRGVASKLGYDRGEAMDAGFFDEYSKTFRGAGIVAVITFSGNCLPEENVPATVYTLSFHSLRNQSRGAAKKLKDVPSILLSECWNDYRAFVGKGTFDPQWEKKMPW